MSWVVITFVSHIIQINIMQIGHCWIRSLRCYLSKQPAWELYYTFLHNSYVCTLVYDLFSLPGPRSPRCRLYAECGGAAEFCPADGSRRRPGSLQELRRLGWRLLHLLPAQSRWREGRHVLIRRELHLTVSRFSLQAVVSAYRQYSFISRTAASSNNVLYCIQ